MLVAAAVDSVDMETGGMEGVPLSTCFCWGPSTATSHLQHSSLLALQPPYICTAVTDNVQYTAVSAVSPASWLLSQCNPPKDFCNYNIA